MTPPRPARARPCRRLRGDDGAVSAELVLATPALLFMLLLVVHVGLWFHATNVAQAAAQEGARAARVETGSAAAGQQRAREFLDSLGSSIIDVDSVAATRTAGVARVEVRGHAAEVVPFFRLRVHAVSEGPVERFRPATP